MIQISLCATLLLLYTNILTLGYSTVCRYYYHKWACDYFLCDRWCFYFVNVQLSMVNSNTVNRVLTCCVPYILTHAESSVFKSFRVHIYDPFSKTRKSLELKTAQEQLAGIPCKMSKDEQKQISNKKVTLILPLTFFWKSTAQIINCYYIVFKLIRNVWIDSN